MSRHILLIPLLLSFNAGFVDTAGFLALQGLFTAHVTGNFVTFGAAMVLGASGGLAKLLALPVFCLVVIGTRIFSFALPVVGLQVFRSMLALKVVLLAIGGALAVYYGPFPKGDSVEAICTGMVLVAAMAIQNAAHRIHMGTEPPSTLMTGTTTQIMIDVADFVRGAPATVLDVARPRVTKMALNVAAFALGCAGGAILYATVGVWCFVLPPLIALPAVFLAKDQVPK